MDPNSPSVLDALARGWEVSVPLGDLDEAFGHLRTHNNVIRKGKAGALAGLLGGSPSRSRPLRTDEGEVSDADSEARWAGWTNFAACQRSCASTRGGVSLIQDDTGHGCGALADRRDDRVVGRDEDEAALRNLMDLPNKKKPR